MNILDALKGKKIKIKTEVEEYVTLIIKEITENHNSYDLEPATPQNDWWPAQSTWVSYTITFTNGYSKTYNSLSELDIEP